MTVYKHNYLPCLKISIFIIFFTPNPWLAKMIIGQYSKIDNLEYKLYDGSTTASDKKNVNVKKCDICLDDLQCITAKFSL